MFLVSSCSRTSVKFSDAQFLWLREMTAQISNRISNLFFNTVKNSSGFLLYIKYNYITISNNKKYISEESLKNTSQNNTKLHLFSMNAVYLT